MTIEAINCTCGLLLILNWSYPSLTHAIEYHEFFSRNTSYECNANIRTQLVEFPWSGCSFNKKVTWSIEFESNILFWESNRVKNYEYWVCSNWSFMSNDLEWLHKFVINIFKNVRSLHAESMILHHTYMHFWLSYFIFCESNKLKLSYFSKKVTFQT